VRVALNPFFSTVGWELANLISGATLISVVLSLQTTGPIDAARAYFRKICTWQAVFAAAQLADGHRYADIGHSPGVGRSAHPPDVSTKDRKPAWQTTAEKIPLKKGRMKKDLCRAALAVDVVEVPQAQDGPDQRRDYYPVVPDRDFLRVRGTL
jgi:hypothetical protein